MKLDSFVIFIFSATLAILTLCPVYSSWPVENSCPSQNSKVTSLEKRDFKNYREEHGETSSTSYQPSSLPPPNPSIESSPPLPPPAPSPGHLQSNSNQRNNNPKKGITEDSSSQAPQSSQDVIDEQSLQQEEETIHRVIVVLASLGASLFLVAIAIAVLYCQVRKQQKLNKEHGGVFTSNSRNASKSKGLDPKNTEGENDVIDGTANASDIISEDDIVQPILERQSCPPRVIHESEEGSSQFLPKQMPYHKIKAIAPPAEIMDQDDSDIGELSYSLPPLYAPPAYTPTAPPIHSLPHSPITDFGMDVTLAQMAMSLTPSDTGTSTSMSHSTDAVSTIEVQSGIPQPTLPTSGLDPSPDDTSAHHHHNSTAI